MNFASISVGREDGLRRFLANVFIVMTLGLVITAGITWWISHSPGMMESLFSVRSVMVDGKQSHEFTGSGWWWSAVALEFAIVLALCWGGMLRGMSVGAMLILFIVYAGLNGITLAPAIYAYTDASVVKVFFITAGTFAACAAFGHTTKVNLLPMGTFFLYSLIGLIIALVVNAFFRSPVMDFMVSGAAVILFAGLTAYDVQKLREMYRTEGGYDTANLVVYGGFTLYLDFVNMMLHLLRLFGTKK